MSDVRNSRTAARKAMCHEFFARLKHRCSFQETEGYSGRISDWRKHCCAAVKKKKKKKEPLYGSFWRSERLLRGLSKLVFFGTFSTFSRNRSCQREVSSWLPHYWTGVQQPAHLEWGLRILQNIQDTNSWRIADAVSSNENSGLKSVSVPSAFFFFSSLSFELMLTCW